MSRQSERSAPVAGNGLFDRRQFLKAGLGTAGAGGIGLLSATPALSQTRQTWNRFPGRGLSEAYGSPSRYESDVARVGISAQKGTNGSGGCRTPLELLHGIITPSGLHFERHHSGIPDIDPAKHQLLIHGHVKQPLTFSVEALSRYPMVSRIYFLECGGNSGVMVAPEPAQKTCGELHGLVSNSEWTGVPLKLLLEEAGIEPQGKWLIAEGADAALMSRSIPLEKAMDDTIIALYQNGERLRPENGYPMRLLLPGWEGNMSVKWLHRIKVTDQPAMTKDETSRYSDLQSDGSTLLFTYPMGVRSVITNPSAGLTMGAPGLYQISGLAWSGAGKIRQVEISADGGKSWAEADLEVPVLTKSFTRFNTAWQWDGSPSTLMSRAVDETGAIQPTRQVLMANRAPGSGYHYNAIVGWRIENNGEIRNIYV